MNSFKEFIYKISAVNNTEESFPCDSNVSYEGRKGVFKFNVDIGTGIGEVKLKYNAIGIPDRFKIYYDGGLVADSKYVGDSIYGNPPDYAGISGEGFVGNTYNNIPEKIWNGTAFVTNGLSHNISVTQSDVASYGNTSGIGELVFTKTLPTPSTMMIEVVAPLESTAWNLEVLCPELKEMPCGDISAINAGSPSGEYITEVNLSEGLGLVVVDYSAGNTPDRFKIEYDGVLVADSRYVGDYFTGTPPNADATLWGDTGSFVGKTYSNLPKYKWTQGGYVLDSGTVSTTITQSDVGDYGQTQGSGALYFEKSQVTPGVMKIITTSPTGEAWFSIHAKCPVEGSNRIKLKTNSNSGVWQVNSIVNQGSTLRWDATEGVVYGKTGNNPEFNLSSNAGIVDMYIHDTSDVIEVDFIKNADILEIDTSGNVNLQALSLIGNPVSNIVTTGCTSLIKLYASGAPLTAVDISTNVNLEDLDLSGTSLSTLDIGVNNKIHTLKIGTTNLTPLNKSEVIIDLDNSGVTNGTLFIDLGRDSSSDAAKDNLETKGWVITEM